MSLVTGNRIYCCIWKELLISDDVNSIVSQLSADEGKPFVTTHFNFEWRIAGENIENFKDANNDEGIEDLIQIE